MIPSCEPIPWKFAELSAHHLITYDIKNELAYCNKLYINITLFHSVPSFYRRNGIGSMNWLEEYSDQGFVVFSNLLPHSMIDAHVAEVTRLFHKHGATNSASFSGLPEPAANALMAEMAYFHLESEPVFELVHHRILRTLLRQLFQAEPLLSMARNSFWETGNTRAHVDTAFRSPEPPYNICRTWCALEDIDPRAGNFYLLPGTHRTLTPRLCKEVIDEDPGIAVLAQQAEADPNSWFRLHGRGWPRVNGKIPSRIDANCKTSFDLKKGDVILFNPALAHGTLACEDQTLSRKMMLCEWSTPEAYMRGYSPRQKQTATILPFERTVSNNVQLKQRGRRSAKR